MFVVIDATVTVGVCAREASKIAQAEAALQDYDQRGYVCYAPHLLVMETLYVLCNKHKMGHLLPSEHSLAVKNFEIMMQKVLPPPNGDASLIARSEEIRGALGCSHSADSVYLALAEELAKQGATELLTFDEGQAKQAASAVPQITVNLLTP